MAKNAISNPCSHNPKQRFKCTRCKTHEDVALVDPGRLLLDKLRPKDWKAIEMLVSDFPWDEIVKQCHVKQQTVKGRLRKIFKAGMFGELKSQLCAEHVHLDEDDFRALEKVLAADAKRVSAFRRAGQLVGKRWRERAWETDSED